MLQTPFQFAAGGCSRYLAQRSKYTREGPSKGFAANVSWKHETRYAITSLAPNASEILRAARLHWSIENGFHRCLNVAFRKDTLAIRLRNAAANFALLRRFALNLFRLDKSRVKNLPKKRKAAAWNFQYVVDLLKLRQLREI
jgi:predicted transposase YbfD/YdcC